MNIRNQIKNYINSQSEPKNIELQELHELILNLRPSCKLWFLDGKNEFGKVISNPNIGYGSYTIHYANGTNREFYQIGLSANKTGISVYLMGIEDKNYLKNTFEKHIGKATVSGYCIKFKSVAQIDLSHLESAIQYGFENT